MENESPKSQPSKESIAVQLEKYKKQHLTKFTVAQAGGLECGKCHY